MQASCSLKFEKWIRLKKNAIKAFGYVNLFLAKLTNSHICITIQNFGKKTTIRWLLLLYVFLFTSIPLSLCVWRNLKKKRKKKSLSLGHGKSLAWGRRCKPRALECVWFVVKVVAWDVKVTMWGATVANLAVGGQLVSLGSLSWGGQGLI